MASNNEEGSSNPSRFVERGVSVDQDGKSNGMFSFFERFTQHHICLYMYVYNNSSS